MLLSPGIGQTARCCCCCVLPCCGGFADSFAYPDGPPPAPWTGFFGSDPGRVVAGKLWGADPSTFATRSTECLDVPGTSDVRSASFTLRGGNNNEAVQIGLLGAAFANVFGLEWNAGTWFFKFGAAVTADTGNGNTEGVVVVAVWNSAGDYSLTLDGGAPIVGNVGPIIDGLLFVAVLPRSYNAGDPTDGDWIDALAFTCVGL